jgi:ribosomal protein S18 acetylase RimI-like enzyme
VWHSRGIGTLLIRHLQELSRARDLDAVRLAVGKQNRLALALYERQGYAVIGEEVDCWSYRDGETKVEVVEDCWTMEKRLSSTR